MKFKMVHECYNVRNLEASLKFYQKALGLTEKRRKIAEDGSFILCFIGNDETDFQMELKWERDREKPYNLGQNEFHLAFRTPVFEDAHALHESMSCICYENPKMGIYFINDPDGYWLEIVPVRK